MALPWREGPFWQVQTATILELRECCGREKAEQRTAGVVVLMTGWEEVVKVVM